MTNKKTKTKTEANEKTAKTKCFKTLKKTIETINSTVGTITKIN